SPGSNDSSLNEDIEEEHLIEIVKAFKKAKYLNTILILLNYQQPRLSKNLKIMVKLFSSVFKISFFLKHLGIVFTRCFDEDGRPEPEELNEKKKEWDKEIKTIIKSTLINEILCKTVSQKVYGSKEKPGKYDKILGIENIDKIVAISQNPIGRTPRSNPATYTGVFDDIRTLFTTTKEAKLHGFEKNRFSFNVKGGRCETCRGDGVKKIEMHFLPDIYVPCEVCHGTRYNTETLNIKYKGKNIAEVLDMRVSEALEFFENIPKIKRKLQVIDDVGLGYIKLGQSAPTLSGGEAERVKLAKELQKVSTGKTLYVLDEPTTGLHSDDIKRLLAILQKIVDNKDTVIVIEHNLDVIKTADYIIDLEPEGGNLGGEVIACGTPEEVMNNPKSYTGEYLKKIIKK
ncbi:MAG: hypothetical protein ILA19_03880, partial [Bacilli bacterium]|nr:hypothetical protein [Bacilli bacterium]